MQFAFSAFLRQRELTPPWLIYLSWHIPRGVVFVLILECVKSDKCLKNKEEKIDCCDCASCFGGE